MQKTILPLSALIVSSLATQLTTEAQTTSQAKAPFSGMMNMRKGLLPPEGKLWRGSTIDVNGILPGDWKSGADPRDFEAYYGEPLHIYRQFNTLSNDEMTTEVEYARNGGIVFYSIQPEDWGKYGTSSKWWEIRDYARAVASLKPHQVMVPIGYECDLYIPERNGEGAAKNKGTVQDYQDMWDNFA